MEVFSERSRKRLRVQEAQESWAVLLFPYFLQTLKKNLQHIPVCWSLSFSKHDSMQHLPQQVWRRETRLEGGLVGGTASAGHRGTVGCHPCLSYPQVSDSGLPPLSSSTLVRVHVTEQSRYPPSTLPLEIFITTGEEEFQGGMIGKIHATDRDPQDTLTYSLARQESLGRYFSVGASDGKIIASQGLPHGRYVFNVTVSDGTFTTTTGVHVHVWLMGQEAQQHAVWLGFHQLTPEELVSDHWRNLQRFLSNILDIRRANIHLASLQPAEALASGVDVLLVFEGHSGASYDLQELASAIAHSSKEMEHSVGIQMRSALPVVPCQGSRCQDQTCQETVSLEPRIGPTYSTARLSILTPRHHLGRNCSCNGKDRGCIAGSWLPASEVHERGYKVKLNATDQLEATSQSLDVGC